MPEQPTAAEPLEILDRTVLRQRSIDIFPSTYSTLLSIVQGIALAALAATALPALGTAHGQGLFLLAAESAATLMAIIVIYYNYVWYLLIFRWAPGVFDTVIPLALGASEAVLSATVNRQVPWLVALVVVQVVGALAFLHTLIRSDRSMFADQTIHKATATLLRKLMWMMVAGALSAAAAIFAFSFWDAELGPWKTIVVAFLGIAIVLYGSTMLGLAERTLGLIYAKNDLRFTQVLR